MSAPVIGIDVGGTKVAAAMLQGHELGESLVQPTELGSGEELIDQIVEIGVLHSELDQQARDGVQIVVHGQLRHATSSRFWTLGAVSKRL